MEKLPLKYGTVNFERNVWCRVMTEFVSVPTQGRKQQKMMILPGEISHCCCLKLAVKGRILEEHKLVKSVKQQPAPSNPKHLFEKAPLDGLLHYSPYKFAFCPSKKSYECLCTAEQLKKGHPMHQHPIYHSVLPHTDAYRYMCAGIYPKRFDKSNKGMISADDTWTIRSPIITGLDFYTPAINTKTSLTICRVCLKRDPRYKFKEELCGCRLTNEKYFTSCTMILDEEWDQINTSGGIDVCIVTGECDKNDTGKNEILLAARIYVDGYQIPDYPEEELNLFF
jgi:hypothetical protein